MVQTKIVKSEEEQIMVKWTFLNIKFLGHIKVIIIFEIELYNFLNMIPLVILYVKVLKVHMQNTRSLELFYKTKISNFY